LGLFFDSLPFSPVLVADALLASLPNTAKDGGVLAALEGKLLVLGAFVVVVVDGVKVGEEGAGVPETI